MKPAHLQNFKADINMCIEEQGKELINAVFPSFFLSHIYSNLWFHENIKMYIALAQHLHERCPPKKSVYFILSKLNKEIKIVFFYK